MEGELGGALKENQGWANSFGTAKILSRPEMNVRIRLAHGFRFMLLR